MEIERPYSEEDVERLRGTVTVEHTLAHFTTMHEQLKRLRPMRTRS